MQNHIFSIDKIIFFLKKDLEYSITSKHSLKKQQFKLNMLNSLIDYNNEKDDKINDLELQILELNFQISKSKNSINILIYVLNKLAIPKILTETILNFDFNIATKAIDNIVCRGNHILKELNYDFMTKAISNCYLISDILNFDKSFLKLKNYIINTKIQQ